MVFIKLTSKLTCSESLEVEVRLIVRPWGKDDKLVDVWLPVLPPPLCVFVVFVVPDVRLG